jgi:hypothetical protein
MSARDIDTHGDPNIDVAAALAKADGRAEVAQEYIDFVVKKYGNKVVYRHKSGDGIIDPTLYGPYGMRIGDPDGTVFVDTKSTLRG